MSYLINSIFVVSLATIGITFNGTNNKPKKSDIDRQVAIVQQQAWENLRLVSGTTRDYTTTIKLRIGNGNLLDTDCTLRFPESSWELASIYLNEYQEVLKKTDARIFEVIYRLISNDSVLATDITFSGLWRPFGGSHVHPSGRGMDITKIFNAKGEITTYNINTSTTENAYAVKVRECLTKQFPVVTQYFSPWKMCYPPAACSKNMQANNNERKHLNHMHLTLRPNPQN